MENREITKIKTLFLKQREDFSYEIKNDDTLEQNFIHYNMNVFYSKSNVIEFLEILLSKSFQGQIMVSDISMTGFTLNNEYKYKLDLSKHRVYISNQLDKEIIRLEYGQTVNTVSVYKAFMDDMNFSYIVKNYIETINNDDLIYESSNWDKPYYSTFKLQRPKFNVYFKYKQLDDVMRIHTTYDHLTKTFTFISCQEYVDDSYYGYFDLSEQEIKGKIEYYTKLLSDIDNATIAVASLSI